MPIRTFLLASSAALALSPAAAAPLLGGHWGSTFISPMGEPFHDRGGDALADWFNQADTNHDGEIDPDEIDRYETSILPREGGDPGRLGLFGLPEPVIAADTNLNRGVSLAEFHAAAARRFTALDINHRGALTLAVLETVRPAPPAKQHEQREFGLEPPSN